VIEKIVWLRKHCHFRPAKIAMYLARYHDVAISTWCDELHVHPAADHRAVAFL
jgi:hypothetical protein